MAGDDTRVQVHAGEANAEILRLCGEIDWGRTRGVIFLDPFGASLEWTTLEIIRDTKALDVWYLFPLSSVFRNAPHARDKLTEDKRESITRILGTPEWETAFYREPQKVRLPFFGMVEEQKATRAVNVNAIEAFVEVRLKTVFRAVAKPKRLLGLRNVPLFSLFFAVSNPSDAAIGPAMRIASHLLRRK
jgi:three-Cys-motif partner protein